MVMNSSHIPIRAALGAAVLGLACVAGTASAQAVPAPNAGLMPNPAKGKGLYAQSCASCHGVDLKGSDKGPPFLHRVYEPSHHGDVAFQRAVASGTKAHHWKFGDMAPVKGLSPDDVAHITAYIRMAQRSAGIN